MVRLVQGVVGVFVGVVQPSSSSAHAQLALQGAQLLLQLLSVDKEGRVLQVFGHDSVAADGHVALKKAYR